MFRLNRNERSHWSGNGVHVESELVFMIGRNMHAEWLAVEPQQQETNSRTAINLICDDDRNFA